MLEHFQISIVIYTSDFGFYRDGYIMTGKINFFKGIFFLNTEYHQLKNNSCRQLKMQQFICFITVAN